MSRMKACAVLVTWLAATGCASGPEVTDAATPAPSASPAVPEAFGVAAPVTVVDVNEMVASQAPPVICRDVLKEGSNVLTRRCGTAEDWKRYQRQEAQDSAALVRMMQRGGRYNR